MPRNDNKTQATNVSPEAFLETVEPAGRREDGEALLELFGRVTSMKPAMWGASIIGYGRYRYKSPSNRQGEWMLTGFSPRKASLSIYIMPGFDRYQAELAALGPHKLGKSCLYLGRLSKIDPKPLEAMIRDSVELMRKRYETWDA